MSAPRYQHDCDRCIFLGIEGDRDLYFCPTQALYRRATLVARYGDDGPDYTSMPTEYAAVVPCLDAALRLARERGLVK